MLDEREVQKRAKALKGFIESKGMVYAEDVKEKLSDLNDSDSQNVLRALLEFDTITKQDDIFHVSKPLPVEQTDLYEIFNEIQKVEYSPDYVKIGTHLFKNLVATAYPVYTKPGFLNQLLYQRKNLSFCLHIEPKSSVRIVSYLKKIFSEVDEKLNELHKKGFDSEDLRNQKQILAAHLEDMKNNKHSFFDISAVIGIEANNLQDLEVLGNRISIVMKSSGLILKTPTNYHEKSYKSTLPNGIDYLKRRKITTTDETLASFFPFVKI